MTAARPWFPLPRSAIAWLGGGVIAAIVALAATDIVRGHRQAVAETERELLAQSRVIAEQTARSLQAIDAVLRQLAERLQQGDLSTVDAHTVHRHLQEFAPGLVQADGLVVFNIDGSLRAVSQMPPDRMPPTVFAGQPPFERLRGGETGLMVDNAVKNPGTGLWVFPIGRRLLDRQGRFAGAVGAPGRVDYYQNFWRDAFGEQGGGGLRIALLHRRGWLLARHPSAEAALGRPVTDLEALLPPAGEEPRVARFPSPVDGADHYAVARAVPEQPLVVVVSRDANQALAAWREQAWGSALRTLALSALAAALLAAVYRQLARLRSAQRSLEDSRERYALAAAGADDGIWDWDLQRGLAYESRRARELQGLPLEPETQPLEELRAVLQVHPDDVAMRDAAMAAHLRGDTAAYEVEYRTRRDDGAWRWLHVRALCIRDAAGRATRIAGSVTDIDARKRAEEALRDSEDRFAVAVAGSDDGIWDWNYETDTAYNSARGRRIVGVAPGSDRVTLAEWQALMAERLHPDDAAHRQAAIEAHLAGRTPAYVCEFRMRHDDGRYRWVRVHGACTRDAAGRPLRMAGSVTDIDARRRAEEALRESEERYALAMTGSHEGHWVYDLATQQVFVSAVQAELLGFAGGAQLMPQEAYFGGLPLHPDDHDRVHRHRLQHLAGLTPRIDHQFRIVRRDAGEVRWVHSRGQCFRDADGRPQRLAGATVDVTDRHAAEAALRASEERFALAVAGSNDGILDWDIVADRMFASERAMRMFGLEPDGRTRTRAEWAALLMPRFHPDDVGRLAVELRGTASDPAREHEGEYRVLGADGVYRWMRFRGRSVRDAAGRPIRWAGSVSDVDAIKRSEEALRQSDERYQLAVEGSSQGLWDWDLIADRLYISPRGQLLNHAAAGEPTRPRREWIALTEYHPDDAARVRGALSAHLRGETAEFEIDYRARHHDGGWRWYRQRGVAVRDAQGRATRMAGSMEDVTERKAAEAQRERLEAQLRQAQKLEAIGTLAGGIAHDFNNILSAILGYGELAQREAPPGTPLARHIDAAMSAGLRARSLVERILAFSRGGIGERVPVPVQAVVQEALTGVRATLPLEVVLEPRLEAGRAGLLGDPTQIHQVVLNLAANAVHAMRGRGRLAVTLDTHETGAPLPLSTCTLPPGRWLRLVVADTGSGIEPHVLERLFDPFFTTKEVGVGTGLGLSLVHGIVADLGGGIAVESRPGEGATFTVHLPWTCDVDPAAASAPLPQARGDGQAVLLVDDEEPLVRLNEELLADLGYEPVGFTSGTAALAALRDDPQRFALLLSDENMPGITGSELARAARALRPGLPVVLMSGYVNPALQARAREAGVAEVLAKPLASREIARCLSTLLTEAPA